MFLLITAVVLSVVVNIFAWSAVYTPKRPDPDGFAQPTAQPDEASA